MFTTFYVEIFFDRGTLDEDTGWRRFVNYRQYQGGKVLVVANFKEL